MGSSQIFASGHDLQSEKFTVEYCTAYLKIVLELNWQNDLCSYQGYILQVRCYVTKLVWLVFEGFLEWIIVKWTRKKCSNLKNCRNQIPCSVSNGHWLLLPFLYFLLHVQPKYCIFLCLKFTIILAGSYSENIIHYVFNMKCGTAQEFWLKQFGWKWVLKTMYH